MTATYLVAYPHPHIPQVNRILPCEVTSGTRGTQLIKQLIADYPEYSEDLKSATLWKASRPLVVQLPPDRRYSPQISLPRTWTTNP